MQQALVIIRYEAMDDMVANVDLSRLRCRAYLDYANYSYRLDGNNVDIDTENVELASEQIKYEALTSSISSQFSRMKSVL